MILTELPRRMEEQETHMEKWMKGRYMANQKMQEQCRDAVALSTTLSRTASSSSAATVGKIRADVHAIDVINQMKMLQDGTNHAYVSTELISRIYTILDAYSNQLITGMSTMEEQTNLSAALQELSAALSGL